MYIFISFYADAGGGFGNPEHGVIVEPTEDGLIYMPNTGFCGYDTFEYTITSEELSATATVTVQILCEGAEAATPMENAASTASNTPVTVTVLDNNGESLVITRIVRDGSNGDCTIDGVGQAITYTPGE